LYKLGNTWQHGNALLAMVKMLHIVTLKVICKGSKLYHQLFSKAMINVIWKRREIWGSVNRLTAIQIQPIKKLTNKQENINNINSV
jgi:hypothetical protein